MTVRGTGCMEDDPRVTPGTTPDGPRQELEQQLQQRRPENPPGESSSGRNNARLFEHDDTENQNALRSRSTDADDELPLGSEAHSIGQGQNPAENESNGAVVAPLVDKRLLSLRQANSGVRTNGHLLHSGWTSFNSDFSNLTSCSAHSSSSVEWLLQNRQEDPEKILYNLGFCGPDSSVAGMFSRIPERFLQPQLPLAAALEDDGAQDGAVPEAGAGPQRRTPSRAWGRAASVATASLRLLSYGQQQQQRAAPVLYPASLPASHYGSTASLTPPHAPPRSILSLDNQRALALRGFYGEALPEGLQLEELYNAAALHDGVADEDPEGPRCAHDRRKMFHKTRSKQRQRSLVESGEGEGEGEERVRHHHRRHHHQRRDSSSNPVSAEFSTTTDSTDSGGELSTEPNTPGDVFVDRATSSGQGLAGGPRREAERAGPVFPQPLRDIDVLYIGGSHTDGSSSLSSLSSTSTALGRLTSTRLRLTEQMMQDVNGEEGDSYFLLSPTGRQPTVEKAATLTDSEAGRLEQALALAVAKAREHNGHCSAAAAEGPSPGQPALVGRECGSRLVASSEEPAEQDLESKPRTVSIVVSLDDLKRSGADSGSRSDAVRRTADARHGSGSSEEGGGDVSVGGSGMSLLNVDQANLDRLSDSGSDLTLVDQSSSSGGTSPRLARGRDSAAMGPGLGGGPEGQEARGPLGVRASTEDRCRQVEESPVVYVYHRMTVASPSMGSPPAHLVDENDNVPLGGKEQVDGNHLGLKNNCDDDLPRMSSVQSDSSGFGDTEFSADSGGGHEMASLKVSSLGSSCDSSTTAVSTITVYANNSFRSLSSSDMTSIHTQTDLQQPPPPEPLSPAVRETGRPRAESLDTAGPSARRYVTMCFIPSVKAGSSGDAADRTLSSDSGGAGRHAVPKHYTVVFSQTRNRASSSDGGLLAAGSPGSGSGSGSGSKKKNNERPLSEELAQASAYPTSSLPTGHLRQEREGEGVEERRAVSGLRGARPSGRGVPSLTSAYTRAAKSHVPVEASSPEGDYGRRGSGEELESPDHRAQGYLPWRSETLGYIPATAGRRELPQGHYRSPSPQDELEEAGISADGSSVYSCPSTADSIASGSGSDLLDCHKLLTLINRPTLLKGRKSHLVYYRPKRPLRYWSSLAKKKRLQEETRLAQYAVQKYKAELNLMEVAATARYQMIYDQMSKEDRADVEELQGLWAHVRQQLMETEQLLTQRMRALLNGNHHFAPLHSLHVLQQVIELLKEQLYQKQVAAPEEKWEDEDEAEEDWEEEISPRPRSSRRWGGGGEGGRETASPSLFPFHHPLGRLRSGYSSSSWAELPRSPVAAVAGPPGPLSYSSSTSHLPPSPALSDHTYEQFRPSLLADIRHEIKTSLQTFQKDLHLQQKESEIQRLQEHLQKREAVSSPRSPWCGSRSRRRPESRESDV